jgi:hypothetical protein
VNRHRHRRHSARGNVRPRKCVSTDYSVLSRFRHSRAGEDSSLRLLVVVFCGVLDMCWPMALGRGAAVPP